MQKYLAVARKVAEESVRRNGSLRYEKRNMHIISYLVILLALAAYNPGYLQSHLQALPASFSSPAAHLFMSLAPSTTQLDLRVDPFDVAPGSVKSVVEGSEQLQAVLGLALEEMSVSRRVRLSRPEWVSWPIWTRTLYRSSW